MNNFNKNKEVIITVAGKTWQEAFGGDSKDDFFAPDIHLYLDRGVQYSVSSKYENVLGSLMNKFKGSTVSKMMSAVQKLTDVIDAFDTFQKKRQEAEQNPDATKPNTEDYGAALEVAKKKIQVLTPNVRYQTKLQNLPAWESTEPFDLGSFKFYFYLGMTNTWDARREVYNPAVALARVNQPIEVSPGKLRGPLPSAAWVFGKIGSAVASSLTLTAQNMLTNRTLEADDYGRAGARPAQDASSDAIAAFNFEEELNSRVANFEKELLGYLDSWSGAGNIQVNIGKFKLPRMIVERTSVDFSQDTDQFGFPVWATVTWSGCKSLEIATTDQFPLYEADAESISVGSEEERKRQNSLFSPGYSEPSGFINQALEVRSVAPDSSSPISKPLS